MGISATGVRAVATTGIYCRPGCGASPRPANVAPFPSPVAAEAAGYRSCLRCRPDRHLPAVPSGAAVPGPVATALELIGRGFLDRFGEDVLARRVGYSSRQLRRLFERHIGATPAFVARSRRAHFARRLLDETDLPMPVVAAASGFGSVRQMHRIVESIFRFPPSELRRRRRPSDVLTADGGLRLRVPFTAPFDRVGAVGHLRPRVTPGVESLTDAVYRRTLAVCGNPGVVEVDLGGDGDHLALTAHLPTFDSVIDDVTRVRALLGLDDDPSDGVDRLVADPVLGPAVAARPGLRVSGAWDRFETTVRIVIGQQVSVAGATTIAGRLARRHGRPLPGAVLGLTHLFPTPDALVDLDPDGIGMPGARVATVRAVARAVLDGSLDLYGTVDPQELRCQLLAIPGVGPWTAELVLMRTGLDPDAFPVGDLGLRRGFARLAGLEATPTAAELADRAEAWRPHRALAAHHLWADPSGSAPDPEETH